MAPVLPKRMLPSKYGSQRFDVVWNPAGSSGFSSSGNRWLLYYFSAYSSMVWYSLGACASNFSQFQSSVP